MVDKQIFPFPNTIDPPHGRGCGKRREQVTYIVSAPAPIGTGVPLHHNLIDPVMPWGVWTASGFNPLDIHRGAILYRRADNIYDVIITVGQRFHGEEAYLSPWDFFEEARLFGASRAMSPLLEYEKLTPRHWDEDKREMVGSRMIFLHRKAYVFDYYKLRGGAPVSEDCHPFKNGRHENIEWEVTDNGWHPNGNAWTEWEIEPTACTFGLKSLAYVHHLQEDSGRIEEQENLFTVNMPSFSYEGVKPVHPRGPEINTMKFAGGLFLGMPITGFEYARQADEKQKARLESIGFQVDVLDY